MTTDPTPRDILVAARALIAEPERRQDYCAHTAIFDAANRTGLELRRFMMLRAGCLSLFATAAGIPWPGMVDDIWGWWDAATPDEHNAAFDRAIAAAGAA